jgi:inositol phosphorylceramide synthase catalytic subunit
MAMATETVSQESVVIQKGKNQKQQLGTPLFTTKSLFLTAFASVAYLILSYLLVGFKADQLILVGIFNFCFFASRLTRQFIIGFSIFIIYWIIFDYMKAFPNYLFNSVHIGDLYQTEKVLFGIEWNNTILTPNEYFTLNNAVWADVLAGIFYLCWIPVPLTFAAVLFFKNRVAFFQFSLTFFVVNILGFIGYYAYPAAPPWYVAQYGFDFVANTPGNTAGLSRFDDLFNVEVFKGMYAKSSNVFAAMPSMHAAFMMIVLYYGLKNRFGLWNVLFAVIMVGIWASAIYSGHHYVLDVLAGMFCAVVGISLLQFLVRTSRGKKLMHYLLFHTT